MFRSSRAIAQPKMDRPRTSLLTPATKKVTTPMLPRLEVRVEVRDCAKFVKVVIKKVDDRNAERIMRTEILDRFVIKSPPTDVPVIS